MKEVYGDYFKKYITKACDLELLDKELIGKYNLDQLADAIDSERIFEVYFT